MLPRSCGSRFQSRPQRFNKHPPLGVNATTHGYKSGFMNYRQFQQAPTLGGECYEILEDGTLLPYELKFQQAPTLGGECYLRQSTRLRCRPSRFQQAPTLGGECYLGVVLLICPQGGGFNKHPPLGVNATFAVRPAPRGYKVSFNKHPPLGVNATV